MKPFGDGDVLRRGCNGVAGQLFMGEHPVGVSPVELPCTSPCFSMLPVLIAA